MRLRHVGARAEAALQHTNAGGTGHQRLAHQIDSTEAHQFRHAAQAVQYAQQT
jgi:hypothetical protein